LIKGLAKVLIKSFVLDKFFIMFSYSSLAVCFQKKFWKRLTRKIYSPLFFHNLVETFEFLPSSVFFNFLLKEMIQLIQQDLCVLLVLHNQDQFFLHYLFCWYLFLFHIPSLVPICQTLAFLDFVSLIKSSNLGLGSNIISRINKNEKGNLNRLKNPKKDWFF